MNMADTNEATKVSDKDTLQVVDPRKLFCDRAFVMSDEEQFLFAFQSGPVIASQYVFSPQHAKRFLLRLQKTMAEYEAKYGEQTVTLPDEA